MMLFATDRGRVPTARNRAARGLSRAAIGITLVAAAFASPAAASQVQLKDGRRLEGDLAPISSLVERSAPSTSDGGAPPALIILVDDDLRRVFVSKRQLQAVQPDATSKLTERFNIPQRVVRQGRTVKSVAAATRIDPFDEYGRRIFSFRTANGTVDIVQAITELTPLYAKAEGTDYVWDYRLATSSIPRDTLHKILLKQVNANDVEQLKRIARFYMQAEYYEEAAAQLKAIAEKFADKPQVVADLQPTLRAIRQLSAQRLLDELTLRRDAGQHRLVYDGLKRFPSEDVAGELLQAVRAAHEEYDSMEQRRKEALELYDRELAKITETPLRLQLVEIREELGRELGIETIARMAPFRQNADDRELLPTEKLSLAVSGWLLGADRATVNLPVSISAYKTRALVRQYLVQPTKPDRDAVLQKMQSEEGATPGIVAPLLANMKPPVDPPTPVNAAQQPGFYRIEIPGPNDEPPIAYFVQLPPEYNPYHLYPTVVTLNSELSTPELQIDWWAGPWTAGGWRAGQASRHGYIVIAPAWSGEHQRQYRYTPREHFAVVSALRDACQHFSVDTDRVFLSGHGMGGDAAWDIALAHPDLWAGAIPITAAADKYVARYWGNAEYVPFYFVGGELDGGKIGQNSRDLDRYLARGFNCTVVEYHGRGHENFSDEVLNLFDWMKRFRRDFYPREFTVSSMRPSDNFFWWVEVDGFPPGAIADPANWAAAGSAQPIQVRGQLTKNNGIYVTTGAARATVLVSPRMLDLEQRVNITVNGRRVNMSERYVQPDLFTLIEDVRTRGDRFHPFWAKIEATTGRAER